MSYDMWIGDEDFNITWNVGPMYYHVHDKGIRLHYGLTGAQALQPLRDMRYSMEEEREYLLTLEPDNGWGDYEIALQFVTDLINASVRNSDSVWNGD